MVVVGVIPPLVSVSVVAGTPTMIGVGKPWQDPHFPTVDPVSGTPDAWISAVCAPRVRQVRVGTDQSPAAGTVLLSPNSTFAVPRSTYSAACLATDDSASDPVLLAAQYLNEDSMQLDLASNGVKWYCFAGHQGRLVVIATRADEREVGPNGFTISPVLRPLVAYGFNVYSDPGL
ncbi:hypothetical protein FHT40_003485 [Mycolicibacterium sp. BK556]|uniref:hypothetical protein n=1 Tax=Mycobacteriaceae TaxID=1762 RepID=UPI00105CC162|nr:MULTISPECIES: hypothetical protein [Mycobacteriaceae]MBB3603824.1 hypothetical protein [Mycolicibacterium sp. BK556]MBB3751600.1 hypothetical protein [Mycolicibacterium sp. BK634]